VDSRTSQNRVLPDYHGIRSVRVLGRSPDAESKRFGRVLRELADYLSKLSGKAIAAGAVHQQIAWAVTKQLSVQNAGYARQFIMNKAAALEMGFLTGPELPDYMLAEKEAQLEV
jgi:hypothetical protein